MRNHQRAGAATALLIAFLTLGIFGALPPAARADDVPIIIHKPIIITDPPKHAQEGQRHGGFDCPGRRGAAIGSF